MSNNPLNDDDKALFRQLMSGTHKMMQDTVVHKLAMKSRELPLKRLISEQGGRVPAAAGDGGRDALRARRRQPLRNEKAAEERLYAGDFP